MPFRSLRTLATRTLAAGAASALALTMFNAAQPSLGGSHKISPGTVKDVQLRLSPVPGSGVGPAGSAAGGGVVDNPAPSASGSATLPAGDPHSAAGGRATPGTGPVRAAPGAAAPMAAAPKAAAPKAAAPRPPPLL